MSDPFGVHMTDQLDTILRRVMDPSIIVQRDPEREAGKRRRWKLRRRSKSDRASDHAVELSSAVETLNRRLPRILSGVNLFAKNLPQIEYFNYILNWYYFIKQKKEETEMNKSIIIAVFIFWAVLILSGCGGLTRVLQEPEEYIQAEEMLLVDEQMQEKDKIAEFCEISSLDYLADMGDMEELHDLLEIEIENEDLDVNIDELMETDTLTDETKNIKDN